MKKEEILAKVAAGQLSIDEASKLLADLESTRRGTLYCKVSQKGAVSLYGLQRMPVTLYVEQWERLLGFRRRASGVPQGARLRAETQTAIARHGRAV